LKKRTKKLLVCWLTRSERPPRTEESKSFLVLFFKKELLPSCLLVASLRLERLHPDWKIIGIRRAAPAGCLQSICISLKPPAHERRFQSG
jgi:hypothetical protein